MSVPNRRLALIVHNVRSAHNVGSLLRTADGMGVEQVIFTGYTPYPEAPADERPPHVRRKASAAIAKTALGAEKSLAWKHYGDLQECVDELAGQGFMIIALEQTAAAGDLADFHPGDAVALVVGNEVDGLDGPALKLTDMQLQIPMMGAKESFNVSVAAAIALYHLRHLDKNPS